MTEFKGYDWTELSEALGVIDDRKNYEMSDIELLRKTKKEFHIFRPNPDNVEKCREFIRALLKEERKIGSSAAPVWQGLLEIDDDSTFMQFLYYLLELAWS